ncbi:MAG TPA: GspE/PulE family protein [Candidatus Babeliales bacterium]|nr:GspE/PulE family protein [Candidatus Babeliales bacterium]
MADHISKLQYEREAYSVVQLVDAIVRKAIVHAASDIHIETTEQSLRLRYRIDGVLYDQYPIERQLATQVIARLKVLANIDTTEKRIPQDGKFRMAIADQSIDLRVSTFPSIHGEKVVVRILDRAQTMIKLENLGFHDEMLNSFKDLIRRSSGFFLVSGPTGSGKTTTLYAALSAVAAPDKNIITLEDPVEYYVQGITQGQINPEVGFTFEKGMRALLRQDPNVVMVGEIRDRQTAQIAIEAALTGHLVLSTVHTNDAPSVIMRLMDMAIEPFLINAAVTGVLAQRLARKICVNCRVPKIPNEQELVMLNRLGIELDTIYQGQGCKMCLNLGYKGRIGIFELLTMSSALRALIVKHPSIDAIYSQARADGMKTLLEDGIEKVRHGIITLQELARVIL